jgi:hypothetical protein
MSPHRPNLMANFFLYINILKMIKRIIPLVVFFSNVKYIKLNNGYKYFAKC